MNDNVAHTSGYLIWLFKIPCEGVQSCDSCLCDSDFYLIWIFFFSFWFILQVGQLREISNKVHNAELKLFLEVERGPVIFILWSCILFWYNETLSKHSPVDKLRYYLGFMSHCITWEDKGWYITFFQVIWSWERGATVLNVLIFNIYWGRRWTWVDIKCFSLWWQLCWQTLCEQHW